MNKKNVLWILLDLVFLLVFNVVFFVAGGTQHPASVWISYGFIHFAYIMLLVTPFLIRKSNNTAILGLSLYSISSVYFFLAFITGVVFIVMHPESYRASLIVQVVIAGFYAVVLLSNMIANEHTADYMERHEVELQYVKQSSAKLKGIMETVSDKSLKKKIERAYDLFHSSPAKSSAEVRNNEAAVMDLIEVLERDIEKSDTVAANATLERIIWNANERNRKLKF